MHRRIPGSTVLVLLIALAAPANADISKVLNFCVDCHGEDGRGTESDTPIIAGIPAAPEHIVNGAGSLRAVRSAASKAQSL